MHRHKHKAWWCLLVDTHTQRKQQKQMLCVRIHQNEIHRWLRINIIQHAQIFPSSLFCVDVRVCWLSLSCFVLLFSAFSFGYCHHHHSSPINIKPIISVLAVTDVNFKMVFVIQFISCEWFELLQCTNIFVSMVWMCLAFLGLFYQQQCSSLFHYDNLFCQHFSWCLNLSVSQLDELIS